jgi:trimethylamine--corrinoid protein Co-methyltransferase
MWGPIDIFDRREEDLIHRTMLGILDEVGVLVENEGVLDRLAGIGGRIDRGRMMANFSPEFTERFIAESDKFDWRSTEPYVEGRAHIYCGYFLDPETDRHEPWTVETVLRYLKTAHYLEHTAGGISYSFPLEGIPDEALILFFNYLCLKFVGRSISSVNNVQWAESLLEMCEAAAPDLNASGKDLVQLHIHMISPLRLSREEARIFTFFANRGIVVGVGHMESAGGTAPVTLAGALALDLAHDIFAHILLRAYFGHKGLGLGCSIAPMDMRTGMYPYGRPEKEMGNVAMAQMARRYGVPFYGHCGHADAKRPSAEAGFQKALNAIPTLMASGRTMISCGLLSVDEVFSPVQMIIDNEFVGALRRFTRGFEVSEETLALDVMKAVGPGGCFLDTEHTARHFRSELWEPAIFSRHMFGGWKASGSKTDADYALDVYRDIMSRDPLPTFISPDTERTLLSILSRSSPTSLNPIEPV